MGSVARNANAMLEHWLTYSYFATGAPDAVRSIFSYDAEGDADYAVLSYLTERTPWDRNTGMSEGLEKKFTGWFLPKEFAGRIAHAKGSKL